MKLKKLVSLGLATLMAAGILAGCSGSTTSESAAGDSSASESTAADSGDATLPTAPRLPARKRPSTSSSRCWATSTGVCCRPAPSRPARTWAAMSSWSAPALESDIEGQLTLLQTRSPPRRTASSSPRWTRSRWMRPSPRPITPARHRAGGHPDQQRQLQRRPDDQQRWRPARPPPRRCCAALRSAASARPRKPRWPSRSAPPAARPSPTASTALPSTGRPTPPKPGTILSDDIKVNDGDISKAVGFCQDYLTTYPNIKGMFGPNNGSTVGFVTGLTEATAPT